MTLWIIHFAPCRYDETRVIGVFDSREQAERVLLAWRPDLKPSSAEAWRGWDYDNGQGAHAVLDAATLNDLEPMGVTR